MKIAGAIPFQNSAGGLTCGVGRLLVSGCIMLALAIPSGLNAGEAWYPLAVDVWTPPFNEARQRRTQMYTPLEKAAKPWRIRVFIPHLKDAYWLGVNFGLIDEARRLGISLTISEAGGYDQLDVQRRQVQAALAERPDGIILSAIAADGFDDLLQKAQEKGIPVVDLINGIASPLIAARAAVSYWDNGHQAGRYLIGLQKGANRPMNVAWFPGPQGPAWAAAGDRGFRDAIADSRISIKHTEWGDTGLDAQGRLIEAILDKDAEGIDFIAGTTVSAVAAVRILRRRGLADKIGVLSYYYSPGVHRGIRRGDIVAAPSDLQVVQARIAVDVTVRILEKRDFFKHVAPRVQVVDRSNIRTWDSTSTLAPRGFRPIFSVNEQQ